MSASIAVSVLKRVPELNDAIVRRNAREIVADKIVSLIALGILQLGDFLPSERDLAAALHVSRETVRGAMQMLATRGIIEISHGIRTRIISADVGPLAAGGREPNLINRYDLDAIHAARLLVERTVVAQAALLIDDSKLRLLNDLLEVQHNAFNDPVAFLISDREFHITIYKACGNEVLADFVTELYSYMLERRRKAISRPGAIQNSYSDHKAIVIALQAHDPDAVVAAFESHLERIFATTQLILSAGSADSDSASAKKGSNNENF